MQTAMKPSIEPTDRSIWRMTMISTMPVAMTAIDDDLHQQVPQIARRQKEPPISLVDRDAAVDIEAQPR